MQSNRVKLLSLMAIILAVIIILSALSLFLTTDLFIQNSFEHQRGNRHIIKINLIFHKGVGDAYYSIMKGDNDAFLDAITTIESAAGYMKSLSDDIGEIKPEVWEQIVALVALMENLYDSYLDRGDPIPAAEISRISQTSSTLFYSLSSADILFYKRLTEGSLKIKKNTVWSFALMTILSSVLVMLALLLRRTLNTKIKIASELKLAKDDLEIRIETRTAELAKSNMKLLHEIEERTEVQEAIQSLVGSIVGSTGQQCFDNIVSVLARWLGVECVALAEVLDGKEVRTLSMLLNGEQIKEFNYNLSGTPCEELSSQGYSIFRESVATFFPKGLELCNMAAEGYVGVPVVDEHQKTIGVLFAVSTQALQEKPSWKSVFQIMASKAGSEMARLHSEQDHDIIRNQLAHTQKLEAIGTLAGGIAHDFNNILAAILGYSELLKLRLEEGSREAKANAEVLNAANRAKELIKQILSFSRRTDAALEPVLMHTVVHEAMRLLRQTIPSTIDISLDISNEQAAVFANPSQLHQIVMNLCTNAYHAMRKKGENLTVSLHPIDVEQKHCARIPGLSIGPYLLFSVVDTGEGMTSEVQSKVFEPFFTTKALGEGTGMGMAVVHGIVSNYQGAIDICSTLGQGTRVDIYLPIYSGETQEPVKTLHVLPHGSERVLVVDDEPALAKMTAEMLEGLGYAVDFFTSSKKALEGFNAFPEGYDLVIADQTMPVMSGATLAQTLLKEKPGLPVIIYTGYSEAINEELAQEIGIKALLNKPVERASLARTVRGVLDASQGEI